MDRLVVASADYVLCLRWGKVECVPYVPDLQRQCRHCCDAHLCLAASGSVELFARRIRLFHLLQAKWVRMNAFTEHKDELERCEQMYGRERGRLAVALDRMTNALVLAGQHGVYCTSQRNPTLPAMDLRLISQELDHAKQLVQSVMEELRRQRNTARS